MDFGAILPAALLALGLLGVLLTDLIGKGRQPEVPVIVALASLAAGKHVLTEARMARNLEEARRMAEAARRHPGAQRPAHRREPRRTQGRGDEGRPDAQPAR